MKDTRIEILKSEDEKVKQIFIKEYHCIISNEYTIVFTKATALTLTDLNIIHNIANNFDYAYNRFK